MTRPDQEPLTPEERELARRLARLGAHAEPSAALDARILAAAHAADTTPTDIGRTRARRRPRFAWAAGLGVAASLLLAVGIAWQLRPLPDAELEYSEAPAAAAAAARDEDGFAQSARVDTRAPQAFPAPSQARVAAPEPAAPANAPLREQRPSALEQQNAAQGASAADEEAPVVFDDAAPIDLPAPQSAPPPPAEPAPQPDLSMLPPAETAAARAAPQDIAGDDARKANAEAATRDAARQRRSESLDRIEVTGTRMRQDEADFAYDQPYDDEPPASADSPEVRKAWLARIRELVDENRIDAARASLAEFRRRYPDAPLPDDLRPLLE